MPRCSSVKFVHTAYRVTECFVYLPLLTMEAISVPPYPSIRFAMAPKCPPPSIRFAIGAKCHSIYFAIGPKCPSIHYATRFLAPFAGGKGGGGSGWGKAASGGAGGEDGDDKKNEGFNLFDWLTLHRSSIVAWVIVFNFGWLFILRIQKVIKEKEKENEQKEEKKVELLNTTVLWNRQEI